MRAVQVNDLARNCKKICDEAFAGTPILVARPKKENVILISESTYLDLVKVQEETRLHELGKVEREGDAPDHDEAMNKKRIYKKIANISAGFEIDGMPLSTKDIEALERILSGKTTAEEEISKVINTYKTTGIIED
ncbi:MAG: hypothetical protein FWC91_13105 [Defluviitaleaceae bacterium]|nr:hypothetical protein [Defluviitaleaceae bacterium]